MKRRCLNCRWFRGFDEVEGYCEITGRVIRDPNVCCRNYVFWKEDVPE